MRFTPACTPKREKNDKGHHTKENFDAFICLNSRICIAVNKKEGLNNKAMRSSKVTSKSAKQVYTVRKLAQTQDSMVETTTTTAKKEFQMHNFSK